MGNKYTLIRHAVSRKDIIEQAIYNCLRVMYKLSYPSADFDELCRESKENAKHMSKEELRDHNFVFLHYLPHEVYDSIMDEFAEAYRIPPEFKENNEILKKYFREPIVDKYIPRDGDTPGYRSYDHPEPMPEDHLKVAEEYIDMASGFYKWDRDMQTFTFNVFDLGPCTSRETTEKARHKIGDTDFKCPDDDKWVDEWDSDLLDTIEEDETNEVQDPLYGKDFIGIDI